jgi:mannose-6-phosphate isomerase-like protein (cupin superfamily)
MPNMSQTPFAVPRGGSRSTGRIAVKVSGKDSEGTFAVLEVPTPPDSGPSLHTHHIENEWFYALEGEYDIKVGNQIYHLEPGSSAYGPRLIPHTWHCVSPIAGRLLVVSQPAGLLEKFAEELEKLTPVQLSDPAVEKALFEKYEIEMAGPPLPKKNAGAR